MVLYTLSWKYFLISSTTSSPKFNLASNIVNKTPSIFKLELRFIWVNLTAFKSCVIPSSAKYSHCTGIITESDAVKAFVVIIPSAGGQSIII
ncbi:MAG: hypothetical protein BHW63_02390 [Mycoplasma sp. CAG:611_25_7]|nr:MAG: hypothetical protein BHW63_02390 [Mycoplasma sp. CAG:611_25_7]